VESGEGWAGVLVAEEGRMSDEPEIPGGKPIRDFSVILGLSRVVEEVRKKDATAKQRACYEMRRNGSTWEQVGAAMGISSEAARVHVKAAERNGLPPLPKAEHRKHTALAAEAAKDFAEAGALAPDGVFDMKAFLDIAEAAGVPRKMAMALGRRVAMNYGPVKEEFKKLDLKALATATQEKAQMILSYIDEAAIVGMNAKDLAMAFGILVDKAQLLGGRPTQIYDFNIRRKLEVLMPELLAEAKRRGITVEGSFSHVATD
jgi:hypothetical protein